MSTTTKGNAQIAGSPDFSSIPASSRRINKSGGLAAIDKSTLSPTLPRPASVFFEISASLLKWQILLDESLDIRCDVIRMHETRKLVLLALLVALAIVLRGLEGLIPNPLPWVRIGLANIMTLLAILLFGVKAGVLLTVLRVMIASLLFGTFLSPTFILSFSAGLLSTLVMGAATVCCRQVLSPVGISVLGGVTHNLMQLCVVYVLIVQHVQIFYLLPILSVVGVVTGGFNGWVVLLLYRHITSQLEYLWPPLSESGQSPQPKA